MKFKVGQIWEDGLGYQLKIVKIWPLNIYRPIEAKDISCGHVYHFTSDGSFKEEYASVDDLKKLICDVQPEPKKALNFWEAREAILSGKTVKAISADITLTPDNWKKESFNSSYFDLKWEIVVEPIQVVTFHQVFSDGTVGAGAYPRLDTDSNNKVRIAMLEIITDQDGKLISAKNI